MDINKLRVKIYCDSADLGQMREMTAAGLVCGYTSNPSLCRKAGITNYLDFCRKPPPNSRTCRCRWKSLPTNQTKFAVKYTYWPASAPTSSSRFPWSKPLERVTPP